MKMGTGVYISDLKGTGSSLTASGFGSVLMAHSLFLDWAHGRNNLSTDRFPKWSHDHKFWMSYSLPSEKAMAPHSSTLAWKIPWTEKPGGLQSMGSRRVGLDWATSLSLFTFMHWRRKWQPTPVFLPGESKRRGSLVGCRLWGRTESDMTEVT